MKYNTDKSKQDEILYLLNSRYAELDIFNNFIKYGNEDIFMAYNNNTSEIIFYTLAGTPFSRELNRHFQEVLERKDIKVMRDDGCMYSRLEDHSYIIRIKASGK